VITLYFSSKFILSFDTYSLKLCLATTKNLSKFITGKDTIRAHFDGFSTVVAITIAIAIAVDVVVVFVFLIIS